MTRRQRAEFNRKARVVLRARRNVEETYVRRMRAEMRYVSDRIVRAALGRSDAKVTRARDAIEAEIRRLTPLVTQAVTDNFRDVFDDLSKATAESLSSLGIGVRTTPRVAMLLQSKTADNVRLIKDTIGDLQSEVLSILESQDAIGVRHEDLASLLYERADVSQSRASLIARDQTLKLNGSLNEARQTEAGIESYTWSTSKDDRVRPTHAALDGETFSWDSPPEPGHPGQDIQCRCIAIPVVDEFEGLQF